MAEEFAFPFEPYGVQKDFMKNLYDTIEKRKIGIFESPTGTGFIQIDILQFCSTIQ